MRFCGNQTRCERETQPRAIGRNKKTSNQKLLLPLHTTTAPHRLEQRTDNSIENKILQPTIPPIDQDCYPLKKWLALYHLSNPTPRLPVEKDYHLHTAQYRLPLLGG